MASSLPWAHSGKNEPRECGLLRRLRLAAAGVVPRRAHHRRGRPVRRGVDRCAAGRSRRSVLHGLTLPGFREHPQPRVPSRTSRSDTQRRRHVLDVAEADVRSRRAARSGQLPRLGPGHVRRDGARGDLAVSASSTTCITTRTAASYADPNAMGAAVMDAARDAGIRITLLDTCYLSGGLDATGAQPLLPEQRRFGDVDAEDWASRVAELRPHPHARVGAAIHSVRGVPRDQLPTVVRAAEGRPLHVHLSEQPAENEQCLAAYGMTPTALLSDAGASGAIVDRGARHAPHRRGRRRPGRHRYLDQHVSDHRARSGRRDRAGARAGRTPVRRSFSAATSMR